MAAAAANEQARKGVFETRVVSNRSICREHFRLMLGVEDFPSAERADWSWSDRYNTSYSADPRLVQASYHWLGLRVGAQRGHVEFVAWVDNALDRKVSNLDAQLNLFSADPSYQTFLQAPRSYGLTARVSY